MKLNIFLIVCIFVLYCSSDIKKNKKNEIQLAKKTIKIEKTFKGELIGINFLNNQFIIWDNINSVLKDKNIFKIFSFKGILKKKIELNRGDSASPIDISIPTYFQYLNKKYIILDEYSKIVVFDNNFKFLYSTRFHSIRNSIDFFEYEKDLFFVIGERKKQKEGNKYEVSIKKINQNHLLEDSYMIDSFSCKTLPAINIRIGGKRFLNFYYFVPAIFVFEKNEKIFYSFSKENKYYIFDMKTKKTKKISVPFLYGHFYSVNDAEKIGYYRSSGWENKMKKRGTIVKYLPYDEKLFHLGFWDVGEGTIAFIGFIDIESLSIRIDLINSKTGKYKKSIMMKIGKSFIKGISSYGPGFHPTFFNYENSIYLWQDKDPINLENLTYFQALQFQN